MSSAERTGKRDLLYNDWHREHSLARYMTPLEAFNCAAIDIDFCEFCRKCFQPIALIEVQKSRNFDKPYTVTRNVAIAAGVEAWVASYWTTPDDLDLEGLCVQRVNPLEPAAIVTPSEWALILRDMRFRHEASSCKSPHALRAAS